MIVRIGSAIIDCKEAHTPGEHAVGLSQTESLAPGMGMAFFFSSEEPRTFWMPGIMKFPLDIIFVGADQKISMTHRSVFPGSPDKYSGRGQYVVEVPAGFCTEMGIKVGDKVAFDQASEEREAVMSSDLLRTLSTASLKQAQVSPNDISVDLAVYKPKIMSIQEFLDCGLLQEINRQMLHPMGLALGVFIPDGGIQPILHCIYDHRDDPEGINFEKVDQEKVRRVVEMFEAKRAARETGLGYHVQKEGVDAVSDGLLMTASVPVVDAPAIVAGDICASPDGGEVTVIGRDRSDNVLFEAAHGEVHKLPSDWFYQNYPKVAKRAQSYPAVEVGDLYASEPGGEVKVVAVDDDNITFESGGQPFKLPPAWFHRNFEKIAVMEQITSQTATMEQVTAQVSESTESDPYSREPSVAPSRPTERFQDHETFDNQIPEGGKRVTDGPIHDEEWNSPTRG